jgi:hypothetical protein
LNKIRQGTIIATSTDAERHDGFIITADCDIANDKYGRYISYLRIVDAPTYIEQYWFPDYLSRRLIRLNDRLSPTSISITHSDVPLALDKADATDMGQRMSKAVSNAMPAKQIALVLYAISNATDVAHCLACFAAEDIVAKGVRHPNLSRLVKDSLSNARSDYLFFADLPGLAGMGHVILLRELLGFDRDAMTGAGGATVRALGETSDRVRFLVGQAFAQLYARIGLEQSLEADHVAAYDLISEEYGARQ